MIGAAGTLVAGGVADRLSGGASGLGQAFQRKMPDKDPKTPTGGNPPRGSQMGGSSWADAGERMMQNNPSGPSSNIADRGKIMDKWSSGSGANRFYNDKDKNS